MLVFLAMCLHAETNLEGDFFFENSKSKGPGDSSLAVNVTGSRGCWHKGYQVHSSVCIALFIAVQ